MTRRQTRTRWRGAAVSAEVRQAALDAVDETTGACVDAVKSVRSGRAAQFDSTAAAARGGQVTGRWGLWPEPHGKPHWELMIETGNAYYAGDNARRRAIDQEYPKLSDRIRKRRRG